MRLIKKVLSNEAWLILLGCSIIYLSNQRTIAAGDSISNSILGLNWLANSRLDLENFRNSYLYKPGFSYYFTPSQFGYLTSTYPIGVAILSFPICVVFYVFLVFSNHFHQIDLTTSSFEVQRLFFEKLASVIIASLAALIFYFSTRLKFDRAVAIVSTFIYAFATNAWVINSQALWQHGSTNLVLISILFCLLKANRLQHSNKRILLIIVGVLCGLLLSIRPTNAIFLIAIAVYSIFTYRKESLFVLIGFPSVLLGLIWNLYNFGNLAGGYAGLPSGLSLYSFTVQAFLQGFLGLLFSPSRGLFVYSPILIYTFVGIAVINKFKVGKDEKLLICLFSSCLILLLQYSFYHMWWAGHCYGPRFLADILPIACYLINYAIDAKLQAIKTKQKLFDWQTGIFSIVLAFSVFVQIVGAFGNAAWEAAPVNVDFGEQVKFQRLWDIKDSQIERNINSIVTKLAVPHLRQYVKGQAGRILEVQDVQKNRIASLITKAGSKLILRAKAENTGMNKWLGYQTGIGLGETKIRVAILDSSNHEISDQRLYISGKPGPQQVGRALGLVDCPSQPGRYLFRFNLIAEGFQDLPVELSRPDNFEIFDLDVVVK